MRVHRVFGDGSMVFVGSKSKLAIALSKLKGFTERNVSREQYEMDSEVGASSLWNAYILGDIEGNKVYDLGCGTGILGIGAILLGAKKAVFVDIDEKALEIAKSNVEDTDYNMVSEGLIGKQAEFIHSDISKLANANADVVIQNPPFGTKVKNSDRQFIEKALEIAPIVYSFHKSETLGFLEGFCAKNNARITHIWPFKYAIKASYSFHRRQIHRIEVSCIRIERTDDGKNKTS